jgi:dihydroflavonol-4-reductase
VGAPSRTLVTGATGFLGGHVARALVARGHEVRVLVRPTSERSRLEGLPVEVAEGDVTDAASVTEALSGADLVIHCAALVDLGNPDHRRMEAVNVGGAEHVLCAAADAGVPAVHVSSVNAHGPTGPDPVDERWWVPDPPTVGYEATKRRAHEIALALAADGAPVRIATPGGIYGFGDQSSMANLIATFVRHPTPIGYLPDRYQSVVDVRDCAEGLVLVAERGRDGEEYILCADAVPFRRWFELIAAGAGRRPPLAYVPTSVVRASARPSAAMTRLLGGNPGTVTDTVAIATRHSAYSGAKARRELGWDPRPLAVGMAEMAAAIRADDVRRAAGRDPSPWRARLRRRPR